MRRTFFAVLIAFGLVFGLASPVPAGTLDWHVTISATCNTATDEYDVVFDLVNDYDVAADITVTDYEVDADNPTPPTFSPDPLPDEGASSATDTVAGTTQTISIQITLTFGTEGDEFVQDTLLLDGDCGVTATTTTAAAAAAVEVATTAQPAVAQASSPQFTG